jgi:hypothetical protein
LSQPLETEDLLVIVPGILGSRLRRRDGAFVWGGLSTFETLRRPAEALALVGDGLAVETEVVADGLVGLPMQLPGLSKVNTYNSLLRRLGQRFRLDHSNLLVFPYDWRLSCAVNGQLLADRVDAALTARRRHYHDAQVTIIAHSMGGLVTAYFTDVLGGARDTSRVITVGTPFRGAAKAVGAIAPAPGGPLARVRDRIADLVRGFPSVHELLPRYRAVVGTGVRRALTADDLPDDASVRAGLGHAARFHELLEAAPVGGYRRHVLVGAGQRTPQFLAHSGGRVVTLDAWTDEHGRVLDERGDGTVPRQSIAPAGWSDDADAIPFAQPHVALPGTDDAFRAIEHILTARTRVEQSRPRAALALEVPDVVVVGEPLEVSVDVLGDHEIPLLVEVRSLDARIVRRRTPAPCDGRLATSVGELSPGDYTVHVAPATRMPDVRPVWDLVTVLDHSSM